MPFAGIPVVDKITDRTFRITGVRLVNGGSGIIGFIDSTVPRQVELLAPDWAPYMLDGELVGMQDMVQVMLTFQDAGDADSLIVTKTGATHASFAITIANAGESDSPLLEIIVNKAG